jgi:hypothetical protein
VGCESHGEGKGTVFILLLASLWTKGEERKKSVSQPSEDPVRWPWDRGVGVGGGGSGL